MHKVFNEILLRGVLPALGQQIPCVSDLGIFESQNCLRCPQDVLESLSHNLGTGFTIEVLSEILPMCAGQNFFQTLCTRIIESILLGMVWKFPMRYVFVFDFWN